MTPELSRFMTLFERMVQHTEATLDRLDPAKLDWAPIENSSTNFGARVTRITVKALVIHTILAETNWIRQIPLAQPGGTIPLPNDPDTARRLNEGDFRAGALALHRANMQSVSGWGPAELDKPIEFVGRKWTGMGLLWGAYAHRAFHLGNIDIYLRQADVVPPEFFEFEMLQMA